MGAAKQPLHAVKDADHGFSGDGGARVLVDFGEEQEFLRLCLHELSPLDKVASPTKSLTLAISLRTDLLSTTEGQNTGTSAGG
jgi:hypothetical protein